MTDMAICSENNCKRIATVGKICKFHYNKNRLANITKICEIENCDNKVMAKGFCAKHYYEQHYKRK